jgi:hypothetical protein
MACSYLRSGLDSSPVPFRQPYFLFSNARFLVCDRASGSLGCVFRCRSNIFLTIPMEQRPHFQSYPSILDNRDTGGRTAFFYRCNSFHFIFSLFSSRPKQYPEAWDGLLFRAAAREDIRNRRVSYTAPKRNYQKIDIHNFFLSSASITTCQEASRCMNL